MNKHFATIVVALNSVIIIGFLSVNHILPPAPEKIEEIVEEQKVAATRCRNCSTHVDLSPGAEKLDDKIDANAQNVKRVITVINNSPPDPESLVAWIETDHLIFRNMRLSDADALYAMSKKPEVAALQLAEPQRSKLESIKLIKEYLEAQKNDYPAPWAVQEKETGRFIGTASHSRWNPDEPRVFFEYVIDDSVRGKGYELETARALIEFGLAVFDCNRIAATARCDDQFSQRILEMAGMSCEGIEPDYKKIGGSYVSLYSYALLQKEVHPRIILDSVLTKRRKELEQSKA